MLSFDTRRKLADTLLTISDGERQIEIVRQILCEQIDFEPYAAFRRIDRHRKTAIDATDIICFLADNKVFYTENNCRAFITRYDLDGDNRLSFNEFLLAVLPMDNPTLRTVATQRANYDVAEDQLLAYDVEYSLAKVIDREISFYMHVDHQKANLHNCYDFNIVDAFAAIDRNTIGVIDFNNLEEFFKRQGVYPNEDELIALLRRLDRDDDGRISQKEFALGLEPNDALLQVSIRPTSPLKSKAYSPVRNASQKADFSSFYRTASPLRKVASPFKSSFVEKTASPTRPTRSPLRKVASPLRKQASPLRRPTSPLRKQASPLRKPTSPIRRQASPLRRPTSPLRKASSPLKKVASPTRYIVTSPKRIASPLRTSTYQPKKVASPLRALTRSPLRGSGHKVNFDLPERSVSPVKSFNQSQSAFRSTGSTLKVTEKVSSPVRQNFAASSSLGFRQTSPLRRTMLSSGHSRSPVRNETLKRSFLEEKEEIKTGLLRTAEKSILKKSGNYSSTLHSPLRGKTRTEKKEIRREEETLESGVRTALVEALKQFIHIEKDLEASKQDLSLRPDFNLLDFFRTFDVEGRGSISSSELAEGMRKYGIYANKEELYLFLRRFDRDNDGKLKFSDFTEAFTCKQQEYANLLNNRTPINADLSLEIDQAFSEETKKAIARILRAHLDNEGTTEALRQRLARRYNFNVHEAFTYLDVNGDGIISLDELGETLDRNDFYATQRELKLLMDRLDCNRDGKVTYSEFVQEMTPKSEKAF